MAKLIIQISGRYGRNTKLIKYSGEKLLVGRGLTNDIVVSDPYVAPQQIQLYQDGTQWKIKVLDRTNPVMINGEVLADDTAFVSSGDNITIGRTHLGLFSEDHPVEATRKLVLSNWLYQGKFRSFLPVMLLIIVCLLQLFSEYQSLSATVKWGELVSGALLVAFVILCWAGLWALIGRLLRHQPHFFAQLFFTTLIFGVSIAGGTLHEYAEYMSNSIAVGEIVLWVFSFSVLTALLKFNLIYASNLRNTTMISMIFNGCLILFIYGFSSIGDGEFSSSPQYTMVVKPPFAQVISNQSIDDYLRDYEAQFSELDDSKIDR